MIDTTKLSCSQQEVVGIKIEVGAEDGKIAQMLVQLQQEESEQVCKFLFWSRKCPVTKSLKADVGLRNIYNVQIHQLTFEVGKADRKRDDKIDVVQVDLRDSVIVDKTSAFCRTITYHLALLGIDGDCSGN